MVLKEVAPGWTPEEVQALTEPKLIVALGLKEIQLQGEAQVAEAAAKMARCDRLKGARGETFWRWSQIYYKNGDEFLKQRAMLIMQFLDAEIESQNY